jgi:hypothetical protein
VGTKASTGAFISCSAKALALRLSSLAKFFRLSFETSPDSESWFNLRPLDEVSLGQEFVKVLIMVDQTLLKSVF